MASRFKYKVPVHKLLHESVSSKRNMPCERPTTTPHQFDEELNSLDQSNDLVKSVRNQQTMLDSYSAHVMNSLQKMIAKRIEEESKRTNHMRPFEIQMVAQNANALYNQAIRKKQELEKKHDKKATYRFVVQRNGWKLEDMNSLKEEHEKNYGAATSPLQPKNLK